jgi:GIY-YIG catalytic domain
MWVRLCQVELGNVIALYDGKTAIATIFMTNSIQEEARQILDTLASVPFEDCIPLDKEFRQLPMSAGIYAVKHRTLGILYIGKARTLRDRFRGGHKALLWAFIEELKATDIRIAYYQLDFVQWIQLSSELESLIIQAVNPPYNVRIPTRD